MYPSTIQKQSEIAAAVNEVASELRPHVRNIWWEIGPDWSDDRGIFFRVLLSDTATRGNRLEATTSEVRRRLLDKLRPLDLGLIAYYTFRSESEQASLKEKSWM
jgi:hypothetical protein